MMNYDVIVLGAGMVGVSCALHLQGQGRAVALIDRKAPGLETSYGNAGLIQREADPTALPRDPGFLLCGALNRRLDVRYHLDAVFQHAGSILSYFNHSAPASHQKIAREYETLIALCLETHTELIEQAGAQDLVAPARGYLAVYRNERELHKAWRKADERAQYGVEHRKLTPAELSQAEPSLRGAFAGAVHWTDPIAILSPGALVQAYARLFKQQGGVVQSGDAMTLEQRGEAWQVRLADGDTVEAREVVIALGPWSVKLTSRFGYKPPMFFKRGYHMHYSAQEGHALHHWMMDAETGYLLCPMREGIRLTTGAELANVDAPPTPRQLDADETVARTVFPLGERLNPQAWVGARPCMPDMKPVFGLVPGQSSLWCAFGHAHQGFTLGPITGELLAAQMTGVTPRVDTAPFAPGRF